MKKDKFDAFMEIVQSEARKKGSRFFISSGEGHELITETLECEDLFSWLIPLDREKEFISEKIEKKFNEEKWEQFEIFAIWEKEEKKNSRSFSEILIMDKKIF